MSVRQSDGQWNVGLWLHFGPEGSYKDVTYSDGRVSFPIRQNKQAKDSKTVYVGVGDDILEGVIVSTSDDGNVQKDQFTGDRIRPVPARLADLS